MKKLLFLLLLTPAFAFAEFYPGTITLNNGTTKTGLIEEPSGELSKVVFKADAKAKEEKIKTEEIKGIELTNADGEVEHYVMMTLGRNKLFNPKQINKDSKKSLVRIINKGRIAIYGMRFLKSSLKGNNAVSMNNTRYQAENYFMQREGDDFAFAIGSWGADLPFMTGPQLDMVVQFNFEDRCPAFVKSVKERTTMTNRQFGELVDMYEAACPK
ncbi:hypothetical protein VF13_39635 [Nostoc linckia z16]|nr:hypothetical protein VF13_39635 [Nostoc linckia z16]